MSKIKVHCAYDKMVPIGDIRLNSKNRNKHPKEQIDRLVEIIKYNGVRRCITVSNQSGLCVVGEGRYLAMKKLGMNAVPVNFQDYESEEAEYADGIADNAVGLWSELDLAGINSDVPELGPDFDIDWLGIKDFVLEPADKLPPGDPDAVPEAPKEAKSKRGDVWTLGQHRLVCGDSTSIDDVEKLMAGEKADMVFTDPPYGMRLNTNYQRLDRPDGNSYSAVIGDDSDYDPSWIIGYFQEARDLFLWGADYFHDKLLKGGSFVVWDKRNDQLEDAVGNDFELCWSREHHKRLVFRHLWSGFTARERDEKRSHPTQKPVALAEWFFDRWGKPNDLVVDLYGGSGSTLIACEKTNRRCFMSEIDPHYCDVILARWAKYTGKDPVRDDGAKWSDLTKE